VAIITLEVPDELVERAEQLRERLPDLLALSLEQPALPAATYRYILDFLAGNPSPEAIKAFGPTPAMQMRLRELVEREHTGRLTGLEQAELDEYERIEHLMVLIKAGVLPYLREPV
jgi:hypothetical protein